MPHNFSNHFPQVFSKEHEHRGGIFSNDSFSEGRPTAMQIRPPKGPNVGATMPTDWVPTVHSFTERPEPVPVDET